MEHILQDISKYLQQGQSIKVRECTLTAIDHGYSIDDIMKTLLDAMDIIGKKFKKNDIYVPEVLIASRAFNIALDIISPLMDPNMNSFTGKAVIGTVKGDLHNIGKNLVKVMLKGLGLQIIDLGVDVSSRQFADAVMEHKPDILLMSALLTTTMTQMKNTITLLEKEDIRKNLKIFIGGAPVTSNYARSIGADAYATDAPSAAELAKNMLAK